MIAYIVGIVQCFGFRRREATSIPNVVVSSSLKVDKGPLGAMSGPRLIKQTLDMWCDIEAFVTISYVSMSSAKVLLSSRICRLLNQIALVTTSLSLGEASVMT